MRIILSLIITFSLLGICPAAKVVTSGLDGELKTTLEALLKRRLSFIKKRPATEWRADDSAFFLQELLTKKGYAESSVKWTLPGNDVIHLNVTLGIQYVIGNVYSDNTEGIDPAVLDNYYTQQIIDTELKKRQDAPHRDDYPESGAQNFQDYLKSQGYWDASVTVDTVTKKPDGKVDIKLKITRGALHHILPPVFNGVSPEHLSQITPQMQPFIGQPANTANLNKISTILRDFYLNNGYQFTTYEATPINTDGIQVQFDVTPDRIYKVRKTSVSGFERTQKRRFNRYLSPLRHEQYSIEETDAVVKKLLLTGAFKSVRITPTKVNDEELDLHLEVKEGRPKFIRAYTGFASFDGFTFGASYTDLNFRNKLQKLTALGEISGRGLLGEVNLTEPFFAGKPIALTTRLFALQKSFDGYDQTLTGAEASFLYSPTDYYTIKLSGGVELGIASPDGITLPELGGPALTDEELEELEPEEIDARLRSDLDYATAKIALEQDFDFRDNPVIPTKGFHANLKLEYGAIGGDTSTSYFQSILNTSYRQPLKTGQRLVFRFGAGAILPEEDQDLPINLRLFSGGAESVRSFDERELGPSSISGDPLGGQAFWNATAEVVHPFNDLIAGTLFLDAGNVFSDVDQFSFSDPSFAVGLGVKIDLPVGPVRFEYGYNLNRASGEPRGALHFSIGAQF